MLSVSAPGDCQIRIINPGNPKARRRRNYGVAPLQFPVKSWESPGKSAGGVDTFLELCGTIVLQGYHQGDGQVCALEGCLRFHQVQLSTYGLSVLAVLLFHTRSNSSFQNRWLSRNIVARFMTPVPLSPGGGRFLTCASQRSPLFTWGGRESVMPRLIDVGDDNAGEAPQFSGGDREDLENKDVAV